MPPTFTDDGQTVQHPLELKFNATGWDILCAIEQGFRAQVDVKGKLAEWFLYKQLKELKSRGVIGTISRHIICSGQLFAQFFRSHPEELPEAQRGQLQAQEAVRRLILSVPGPELV